MISFNDLICDIFDQKEFKKNIIYADTSPHFTLNQETILKDQWYLFLNNLSLLNLNKNLLFHIKIKAIQLLKLY